MSTIRRKVTRKRSWHAWSGDNAALLRLVALMRKLSSEFNGGQPYDADAAVLTLHEGSDEVTGSPDDVMQELDRRTVSGLLLTIGDTSELGLRLRSYGKGVAIIALGQTGVRSDAPVDLIIYSDDQGWTRQAFAELSEEIERGVPRWAAMRSVAAVVIYVAVFFSALMIGLWKAIDRLSTGLTWASVAGLLAVSVLAGGAARIIIPAFEILPDGGTPTGGRRIAYWSALLASIPIGIAINLLTR